MTQSHWHNNQHKPFKHSSDVTIVGAGICGLSLAYWLTKLAPKLKLTVVDAETVGHGASGRNAGFYTAGSAFYLSQLVTKYGADEARRYWDFKQESLRFMREELFAHLQADHEFWGSVTLYRDSKELSAQAESLKALAPAGLEQVSAADLASQGLNGFAGGLRFKHEGRVNSMKLLNAIKAKLVSHGVSFIEHSAVVWGQHSGDGVLLECARGQIQSQHVFLALNGYAGQFHPSLAAWVAPKRAQMLALDFGQKKLVGNFYDPPNKVYFRQDPTAPVGTLLVGGMRLLEEQSENSDFDKVTPVIQRALQDYAESLFGTLPVLARWSGVMGFTQEERPYIRAVPFLPHTTFVGGFSGHGMGLAFGTAHEAVSRFLSLPTRFQGILPLE